MKYIITALFSIIYSMSFASTDGFVKYISFTRTQIIGSAVSINVAIRSQGTSKEIYKCNLYFSTDSILDNNDSKVGSLQTQARYGYDGEKKEFEIETAQLLPGTYYLIGAIDELNEVVENNESNNVLFEAINLVKENYEQKIDRITSRHNYNSPGGLSGFTIWTSNIGTTSASDPTYGKFSTSTYFSTDSVFDSQDHYIKDLIDYVPRSSSTTYTSFDTTIPISFYENDSIYLIAIIDSKNELSINDKTNDTLFYKIYLKKLSPIIIQDFSRSGIQYTSTSSYSGNNLILMNFGTKETDVTFDFYISDDETLDLTDELFKSISSMFAPARMGYSNSEEITLDFDLSDYSFPEGNYTIYSVVSAEDGLSDTIFSDLITEQISKLISSLN